jgi:hypothetical protein
VSENRRGLFLKRESLFHCHNASRVIPFTSLRWHQQRPAPPVGWNKTADVMSQNRTGEIAFMTHGSISGKKPHTSRLLGLLDARAASAARETQSDGKFRLAPNLRYWVVVLAPALVVCSIPFAVLLFITKSQIKLHYASVNLLPVLAGCWLIFAVWIALHKGMGSLLTGEDGAGAAWLVLGLINFVAALGTLLHMVIS